MEKVYHTLKPVFDENSRILILGSMPSPLSVKNGFYYGNPQNRFWCVLSAVLSEKEPTTNDEKTAFLLKNRIALWDVFSSCYIEGASDSSVSDPLPNDFSLITSHADIRRVFTTGKVAHRYYESFTGQQASYLPSTSPANRAFSTSLLIEKYSVILDYLK